MAWATARHEDPKIKTTTTATTTTTTATTTYRNNTNNNSSYNNFLIKLDNRGPVHPALLSMQLQPGRKQTMIIPTTTTTTPTTMIMITH
jgi:hypothetical protein